MVRIREIALQVADTDAPVLILGESGRGQGGAGPLHPRPVGPARASASSRSTARRCPRTCWSRSCSATSAGAFSGALRDKPGKFELADKGSILLDEIGEMSPHLQAKLLHVLQDGEFSRLGGSATVKVDARVLASTNAQLDEAVAAGRFREDLYFRLNVDPHRDPAAAGAAARTSPCCARHFFELYAERYRSSLRRRFRRRSLEAFVRHDWPGNVRELENAVRRYVILPDLEAALGEIGRPSFGRAPRRAGAGPRGRAAGAGEASAASP